MASAQFSLITCSGLWLFSVKHDNSGTLSAVANLDMTDIEPIAGNIMGWGTPVTTEAHQWFFCASKNYFLQARNS